MQRYGDFEAVYNYLAVFFPRLLRQACWFATKGQNEHLFCRKGTKILLTTMRSCLTLRDEFSRLSPNPRGKVKGKQH